ncbi:MAG: acyl--CoA ligase [Deltaproteobacteria bacterium]|nr:acyl--CoA ligase [Candidatus Zymogenaceae bacterium]
MTGQGEPITIGDYCRRAAELFGENEAFICPRSGRRLSYREHNRRVNSAYRGLKDIGLRKGEIVSLLCDNRIEDFELLAALSKLGCIGMPLNSRLMPEHVMRHMEFTDVSAVVFGPEAIGVADRIHTSPARPKHFIAVGSDVPGYAHSYTAMIEGGDDRAPDAASSIDDDFCFYFTSGTTKSPRGYIITHRQNQPYTRMAVEQGVTEDERILAVLPPYTRVSMFWYTAALFVGAAQVLSDLDPSRILSLFEEERITLSILIPDLARHVMALPEFASRDVSSLRRIVMAGTRLPPSLRVEIEHRLCPVLYEVYGQQECGLLTLMPPEDRGKKPESVGRPYLGSEIIVADRSGAPLPPGTLGEIISRSPARAGVIYPEPKKPRRIPTDEWYWSGDIGYLDEDGYLYYRGRREDALDIDGEVVFASEIEALVTAMEGVVDCAAVDLSESADFSGVGIFAVVEPDSHTTEEELLNRCRRDPSLGAVVKKVFFVGHLPRTDTGKVMKHALLDDSRSTE